MFLFCCWCFSAWFITYIVVYEYDAQFLISTTDIPKCTAATRRKIHMRWGGVIIHPSPLFILAVPMKYQMYTTGNTPKIDMRWGGVMYPPPLLIFGVLTVRWGHYHLPLPLLHWSIYRVSQKKRNSHYGRFFRTLLWLTVSFFTLLDRASSSHYINTKIIQFGWKLFILWVIFDGLSSSAFARFSRVSRQDDTLMANPENDSP